MNPTKTFQSIEDFMSQDIKSIKEQLLSSPYFTSFIFRRIGEPILIMTDRDQLHDHLLANFSIWAEHLFGIKNKVYSFKQGLCTILSDEGKWGFMNTRFQIVLPQVYYWVGSFDDFGFAIASGINQSGLGVINKTGVFVIPDVYDRIVVEHTTNVFLCSKLDRTFCHSIDTATMTIRNPYSIKNELIPLN